MRRFLFSLLAMSFLGTVIGCRATHGVCDCGCDDSSASCANAAPWAHEPPRKSDAPAPIPEIKESTPNAPKKL